MTDGRGYAYVPASVTLHVELLKFLVAFSLAAVEAHRTTASTHNTSMSRTPDTETDSPWIQGSPLHHTAHGKDHTADVDAAESEVARRDVDDAHHDMHIILPVGWIGFVPV